MNAFRRPPGVARLSAAPQTTTSTTGFPWLDGDMLYAADLNNAFIGRDTAISGMLPLAGGTMQGPLTLAGDATAPLQPVSLQQLNTITGGPYLSLSGGTVSGATTFSGGLTASGLTSTAGAQITPTPIGSPNSQLLVYQGGLSVSGTTPQNIWSAIGTVSGSAPSANIGFNTFQVSGDNSTTAFNQLMQLSYQFGGPTFTGAATGLNVGFSMIAASAPPPGVYYVGANISAAAGASAGGTNTGAGARGELYGLNVAPELDSGATNWVELTSCEIDSKVKTGASVTRRVNLKLVLQDQHAVQGALQDAFIEFGKIPTATAGAINGMLLSGYESAFPFDNTNGVFISHQYSNFNAAGLNPQFKTFIDVSHIRALTAHWLSPGASLDGSGNWTTGPARLAWSAAGASLDVFGQTGGTPTVTAGGSGAISGQVVSTGNGDLYTVTASGGAITALAPIVAATSRTTGPTGSQTITGDGIAGATCTIPWSNARTLSLQPSGGTTVITGNTQVGSNTGSQIGLAINATNGSWRSILYQTAGSTRWQLNTTATGESAGNVGSDFLIQAVANDGTTNLVAPITLTRSTGLTTFGAGISFGTRQAALATDVTQHISLYDGFGGIGVSGGLINIVAANQVVMSIINTQIRLVPPTVFTNGFGVWGSTPPVAKPPGWGAPTGTATRTTFLTSSVTLSVLAEHVKALIDDLTTYALIGP